MTTPHDIIRICAREAGITEKEILGRRRTERIATPRQIAMYLMREKLGLTFTHIGRLMHRCRGDAQFACRKVADGKMSLYHRELAQRLEQICGNGQCTTRT